MTAPSGRPWRVVETSTVTDEELEAILDRETSAGWTFDGIHFVVRENSRRPAMAFVLFRRPDPPASPGPAPVTRAPRTGTRGGRP